MGTGFSKQKKQMKQMQQKISLMQEQIKNTETTGSAGNGLVTIILTGENEMRSIKIKPECVDPEDIEGLEDLIREAYKNAQEKLNQQNPANQALMPFSI